MNEFIKTAKQRFNSETPPFWKKMAPILAGAQGGITAAATMDGLPQWAKIALITVSGFVGGVVAFFGSSDQKTRVK